MHSNLHSNYTQKNRMFFNFFILVHFIITKNKNENGFSKNKITLNYTQKNGQSCSFLFIFSNLCFYFLQFKKTAGLSVFLSVIECNFIFIFYF
jgi:hypothetical protein